MRQTFQLFLILISRLTFGQTEFSIHLDASVNIDSISVSSFNLSKKFTSQLVNGLAIFKIPSEISDQYSIIVADKRIDGWFNSGKIDVYLDYKNGNISVLETLNSPVYERQVKYFDEYTKFLDNDSVSTDFIKAAILQNDQDAFVLVPLNHYLKLFQNDKNELEFVDTFLSKQPIATKEHSIYAMIKNRLEKLNAIKQIDLDIYSLIDQNGNPSKIKAETNKEYIVLDFWFTNCPPCVKEHKEIIANLDIFNDFNTEIIGISTDASQEKWVTYLKKVNINWKNYRIENDRLDKDLGVWSFPTYIILDKQNNVLGSYSNITETIKALKK